MEISPIPIPFPPLGGSSWGALLAGVCCPQSISLYIKDVDPCMPFPTWCCKVTPSVSGGVCWKMIPWSRGSLGGLGVPWDRGGPCLCPLSPPPCLQETRLKEGIVKLKPHEEPLRSELLSGKFTILVGGVFPTELSQLGGLSQLCSAWLLQEPDPVSLAERAGPLRSLHRPVHSQAAPPQQERAARGAPGALLPAGPSCGEVSLSHTAGSPGSTFPPREITAPHGLKFPGLNSSQPSLWSCSAGEQNPAGPEPGSLQPCPVHALGSV